MIKINKIIKLLKLKIQSIYIKNLIKNEIFKRSNINSRFVTLPF